MANLTQEQQELLEKMNDVFGISKGIHRSSFSGARDRERSGQTGKGLSADKTFKNLQEAMKDLTDAAKKTAKVHEETGKIVRDENDEYTEALQRVQKSLDNSGSALDDLTDEYQRLSRTSIPEQHAIIESYSKASKGLTTEMGKGIRNASLFNASLISSHTQLNENSLQYGTFLKNLGSSANKLDSGFLKAAGVFDAETKQIKEGLNADDFAKLHIQVGQAETALAESLGGVAGKGGILSKSQEELAAAISAGREGATELRTKLATAAAALMKQGFSVHEELDKNATPIKNDQDHEIGRAVDASKLDELMKNEKMLLEVAKRMGEISTTNATTMGQFAAQGRVASSVVGNLIDKFKNAGDTVVGFAGKLAEAGTISANFDKMKDGLKGLYKEMTDFNIAQIPATFKGVQWAAMKMGMSFEETVKFMQENKRTLALYGDGGFGALSGKLKDTFGKFGYNMKQASEVIGPAIDSAIGAGINIKNGDQLNNFIDKSMDSFKNISGIVDISAKDYMKMNADLLRNHEIQGRMLGMDKQRALAYQQELIAVRDNYVQMGLSTEQAQEMVKAQEAQQREKVTSKVREAAKGMALAQASGMSAEDSQRYFQLSLKKRNPEEDKEFAKLSGSIGQAAEAMEQNASDQGGTGAYLGVQAMREQLQPTGGAGQIMNQAQGIQTAARAGTAVTQPEARAAGEKGAGNPDVANLGNVVNNISSILENNFSKAAVGAVLGLGGVALQSAFAARALGNLAGGKGLGGILRMIPKIGKPLDALLGKIPLLNKFGGFGGFGEGAVGAAEGVGEAAAVGEGAATAATVGEGAAAATTAGEGAAAVAGGISAATLGAIAAAAAAGGTALYAGYKAARGEDASNWISDLDAKLPGGGLGGMMGSVMGWMDGSDKKVDAMLKGTDAKAKAAPAPVAAVSAPDVVTPPPAVTPMPTPVATPVEMQPVTVNSTPAKTTPGKDVNKTTTTASAQDTGTPDDTETILSVSDEDAQEQLQTISDSLLTAVKLLQQMVDRGNEVPERAASIATRPMTTSFAYNTGRA